MFLIGGIPKNIITALEFHSLNWLFIYGSKHRKYWFRHKFYLYLHNNGLHWGTTVNIFEFLGNITDQIHTILCPKLPAAVRKCSKSSKIRTMGAVPLKRIIQSSICNIILLCNYGIRYSQTVIPILWVFFFFFIVTNKAVLKRSIASIPRIPPALQIYCC